MSTVANSLNKVFFSQRATDSVVSQDAGTVFYGTITEGALLIDDSGDGTALPGPFEALVPYQDGARVAFVLRSRRPLILSVEGGFGASDEYAGLASIGEVNAEAASDAATLAQQAKDRADAAHDAFDEFVPGVNQQLSDAQQAAEDAATDAATALAAVSTAVTETVTEYAVSTSATVPPTSGWSVGTPSVPAGSFAWMRTKVTYGNSSTVTTEPVRVQGDPGSPGDPGDPGPAGDSVTSVTPYYRMATSTPAQPSGAAPAGWTTTQPDFVVGQKLYRSERVAYSSGSFTWTPVTVEAALTVAANLQAAVDAGLMRVAKASAPPAVGKGLSWLVVDEVTGTKGVGLKIANSQGTGWGTYQLLAEDVLVVGPDGTVRIKNGAVTANTLEATLALVTTIIAGPTTGYHLKLDQTGIKFFSKMKGITAPVEMLQINTPGTSGGQGSAGEGNVFALRDATDLDNYSMSINEGGQGSFSDLTVANVAQFQDVIVAGRTLPEVVQSYMGRPIPVPLLSGSLVPNPAASGVQRIGEFSWANPYDSEVQVSFAPTVLPGYLTGAGILMGMWTATTDGTLPPANTASARASGRVRDTAGDTQLVVPAWDITLPAGATLRAHMIMWVHQNATTWTLADGESWRPQVTVNPYPSAETDGVFASIVASAPAPTAKKQYTKTYGASWLRGFNSNGQYNSFYAGKATQGNYGAGDMRGLIGFPNMAGDLGGADIVKVEAYVYMSHWWFNSGGTATIAMSPHASAPASVSGLSGGVATVKTAKPGGAWVTLPSSVWAGLKSGAWRGLALIGVGQAGYGYATTAQLRITYKK